ncbi:MAG: HEAT repeat domain-containing protein, partial [Planctomycetota bacterium]
MLYRPLALAPALFSTLLWTLSPAALADRIGAPYRGPSELLTSQQQEEEEEEETGTEPGGDPSEGEDPGPDPFGSGTTQPGPGQPGTGRGPGGKQQQIDGSRLWQWWFEHNKDRILTRTNERGRVHFGSAYYWFGPGAKAPPRQIDRVSPQLRKTDIFPALKRAVRNTKHIAVQTEACTALGRIASVPADDKDKKDGESDNLVVRELVWVLGATPRQTPRNRELIHSAILALGMTGDPEAGAILLRHFTSPQVALSDREAGYTAVALGLCRHREAIPDLVAALPKTGRHKAEQDRSLGAIHALGLYGPDAVAEMEEKGAIEKLVKLARPYRDPSIVMQAVCALGRLQVGVKTVGKALGSKSPDVRWTAVLALANYSREPKDAKEAVKLLLGRGGFKNSDQQTKSFSLLACGDLAWRLDPNSGERKKLLRHLREQVQANDTYVRSCAAVGCGVAGDQESKAILAEMLRKPANAEYTFAALCLGLGLLRATDQADYVLKEFVQASKRDFDTRGYGALSIALMGDT